MVVLSKDEWTDHDQLQAKKDGWFFREFLSPSTRGKIKAVGNGDRFSSFDSSYLVLVHIVDNAEKGVELYVKAWAIIIKYKMLDRYVD